MKVARRLAKTKWALALVMVVFGALITMQFRLQMMIPKTTDPRAEDVAQELKATQAKLSNVEAERDRLATQLKNGAAGAASAPLPDMTPTELLAGSVAMQGPGLVVTMVENTDVVPKARVHDEDLWRVLNELLAAGAEGVAVNGQRITSVSGIRDVGNRVMVYQTMTNSPFEILAVGDPSVLETALRLRAGVVDLLTRYGVNVTIRRSASVRLPPFAPPAFRFAKPVQ